MEPGHQNALPGLNGAPPPNAHRPRLPNPNRVPGRAPPPLTTTDPLPAAEPQPTENQHDIEPDRRSPKPLDRLESKPHDFGIVPIGEFASRLTQSQSLGQPWTTLS